uniref:Uncharacterized protein n=1 Tax=Physcomitrium patens TaxID=3218 RepID=A0A2K1KWA4_PHYPA|nr:hypothetical protein PHYPA_005025 [Physcomitrium patens]
MWTNPSLHEVVCQFCGCALSATVKNGLKIVRWQQKIGLYYMASIWWLRKKMAKLTPHLVLQAFSALLKMVVKVIFIFNNTDHSRNLLILCNE